MWEKITAEVYSWKMEMITYKMEDCEMDIIKQAESNKERLFGIWVVIIYHLGPKNYLEDLAWISNLHRKSFQH